MRFNKIEAIGGYFELELSPKKNEYHRNYLLRLKNGRSCLKYILKLTAPKKVYLPFYSCNVILEPIRELGIEFEYYNIDSKLEIKEDFELGKDSMLLYINYFGLKRRYSEKLVNQFTHKLIIDNTHDFFYKTPTESNSWYFNSWRKFFGVPDGAHLIGSLKLGKVKNKHFIRNKDYTILHLVERLEGRIENGYSHYIENEKLQNSKIELVSNFSEAIMDSINPLTISVIRRTNFLFLHSLLRKTNTLNNLCDNLEEQVPYYYPYKPKLKLNKKQLWDVNIFIPILWKECISQNEKYRLENELADNILPIPIDQRYNKSDLLYVIKKLEDIG